MRIPFGPESRPGLALSARCSEYGGRADSWKGAPQLMVTSRRKLFAAFAAVLALTVTAVTTGTAGARDDVPTFVGLDGAVHPVSPSVIPGRDGYYFIGSDFDTACAFGRHLEPALERLSRLAKILTRHGKRVLFTVTPNKSVVTRDPLPVPLPQGSCARKGMRIQADLLDGYDDPHYLPIRRDLVNTPHAYWRTDTHWSTAGTTLFAEHVADALDPGLAEQLRYRRTKRTHEGDLATVEGLGPETIIGRKPSNGVKTRPARGSTAFDPTLTTLSTDFSWVSRPARKTYPGRTLLLGDSFTYVASEALTNLFRKGRFMWVGFQSSMQELADAVNASDTVVFTVVQRYATITPLVDPTFQAELKALLR